MTNNNEPVICTLTTKGMAGQVLAWNDLAPLANSQEQLVDGTVLTFPIDLAERIEELADREIDCCGTWLKIATIRSGDVVKLEATTQNPDGLAILRDMVRAAGE